MTSPDKLIDAEDNWQTTMGLSFAGERVVIRGKDLFTELKDMSWIELLLFSITGRKLSKNEIKLFEGIWVLCTSYPDPRVWNNQIASLCGTARSTCALALGAGTAISEAKIYGGQPILGCFNLLVRINKLLKNGGTLEEILSQELEHKPIPGYGRPICKSDERIQPLKELAVDTGFSKGEHYLLAFRIENALHSISEKRGKNWRINMNAAALMSAFLADMNLSAEQCHQSMTLCFSVGMFPCFSDSASKNEACFLPLPCNRLRYNGKKLRNW